MYPHSPMSRDLDVPSAPAVHPSIPGPSRHFYSITSIFAGPIFVGFAMVFAWAGLSTNGARAIGVVAAAFAVVVGAMLVVRPFMATARPDGTIVFRSVIGAKVTTVWRISQIRLRSSGRGYHVVFDFDGTQVGLADFGGSALARFVVAWNPRVDAPPRYRS
jgi:hypothetical protein